jgi:hypothetical protein
MSWTRLIGFGNPRPRSVGVDLGVAAPPRKQNLGRECTGETVRAGL